MNFLLIVIFAESSAGKNPLTAVTPGLYIWTIITFLLLFYVLAKFAWKPLLSMLEERENLIKRSLSDAETAREELQKINLDMTGLEEEESRVKSLQLKLEKSIKTIESDLERERSISLDADLNEKRILQEKDALLKTENVELEFTEDGIDTIAKIASEVNATVENIGARRLHTIIEKILDEISFTATDRSGEKISINKEYIDKNLDNLIKDTDLSKFIL